MFVWCNFGSRVASTWIFCVTHLCPRIHPPTKYQPKIFIHLGDTEQKGISVSTSQGQGQRPQRHDSFARHTFVPPDTSSHQISTNLHSFQRYRAEGNYYAILGQGQRSHRHESFTRNTFVPWYILPQNINPKSSVEIYGRQMPDAGHDSKNIKHPRALDNCSTRGVSHFQCARARCIWLPFIDFGDRSKNSLTNFKYF
jgi:hypothetical protein